MACHTPLKVGKNYGHANGVGVGKWPNVKSHNDPGPTASKVLARGAGERPCRFTITS